MKDHQRIIFNGNGYSDEWVAEAERRGLPNIKSMVEATETLTTDKAVKLFEKFGIFTRAELESREEALYETYSKSINIEALSMINISGKQLIPAVAGYTGTLADAVVACKNAGVEATAQKELLAEISGLLAEMKTAREKLMELDEKAVAIADPKEQAFFYKDVVKEDMDALRAPIDHLEMLVEKDMWPMPSYGDLIFEV